jgi:hypothetical protein
MGFTLYLKAEEIAGAVADFMRNSRAAHHYSSQSYGGPSPIERLTVPII